MIETERLDRENECWCLFSVPAAITYCSAHNKPHVVWAPPTTLIVNFKHVCVATTHAGFGAILYSNKNKVVFLAECLHIVSGALSSLSSSLRSPAVAIDVADAEDRIRGNISTFLKKTNLSVASLSVTHQLYHKINVIKGNCSWMRQQNVCEAQKLWVFIAFCH